MEAEGASESAGRRSRELGCEVRIAACDVSDRAQLEELLASIPEEHPLTRGRFTRPVCSTTA